MESLILPGFVLWLVLCFVAWAIADHKGRFGFGYFLLSFIFSPLVGIVIALVRMPNSEGLEYKAIYKDHTHKKCPFCAELIKDEATVCRFCGRDLPKE